MSGVIERLLELLYPTRCAFCHRLTAGREERICLACLKSLPYVPKAAQSQRFSHLDACLSPLYYEGDVRASLLRYKFGGVNAYADLYADFIAKCIDENQAFCDSITWVPLSRRRLRRRGYDQARLIAEELGKRLGVPCERLLVKIRDNPAQSGIRRPEQRRANVSGVYRASDAESIQGKRIILVDDIVTTGATLSECAAVFRRAGASTVTAVTVARSRK